MIRGPSPYSVYPIEAKDMWGYVAIDSCRALTIQSHDARLAAQDSQMQMQQASALKDFYAGQHAQMTTKKCAYCGRERNKPNRTSCDGCGATRRVNG